MVSQQKSRGILCKPHTDPFQGSLGNQGGDGRNPTAACQLLLSARDKISTQGSFLSCVTPACLRTGEEQLNTLGKEVGKSGRSLSNHFSARRYQTFNHEKKTPMIPVQCVSGPKSQWKLSQRPPTLLHSLPVQALCCTAVCWQLPYNDAPALELDLEE